MTDRDLPVPGDDAVAAVDTGDTGDTVEQHRIRYNPTRTSKLDTAEAQRIRYNPSRDTPDDTGI